eukprot:4909916-Pyramimonas_sp.AAC.1
MRHGGHMMIVITARRHIPKVSPPLWCSPTALPCRMLLPLLLLPPSAAASSMAGPPPVHHGGAALVGQPRPRPHLPSGAHRRLLRPQRRPQEDPR